jgi:hypothetical protein
MLGDDSDFSAIPESPAPEPSESSNKTFVMVAGVIGGLILLSLICLAVLGFWYLPKQNASKQAESATREAQNAQMSQALTSTAEASLWTPTAMPSPVIPVPTDTPVVAIPTDTPTPLLSPADIQTATMAALNTQVAEAQKTPTSAAVAGTATAVSTKLPQGGFADEANLPGIIIVGVALVAVILLVRRLRMAPTR